MKLLLDNYILSHEYVPKDIFTTTYKVIDDAYSKINKLDIKLSFNHKYNKKIISSLISNDNKYIGIHNLKHIIKTHMIGFYKVSVIFNKRHIKIYYVLFDKNDLQMNFMLYTKIILSFIEFCSNITKRNCGKTLDIFIYLTPYKKILNKVDKVIGVKNVNSGVTYACSKNNQICVYRKEEFLKVVFHEILHSLGLDNEMFKTNYFIKDMNQLFNVKTTTNYYEAYTEFTAINFYIYFVSYISSRTMEEAYDLSNEFLTREIYFSMYQMNKILRHNGLTYTDLLLNKNTHLYNEESNVFAYYILKTIMLYHNTRMMHFFWKDDDIHLSRFIQNISYNPTFIVETKQFEYKKLLFNNLEKTMRMTALPEF